MTYPLKFFFRLRQLVIYGDRGEETLLESSEAQKDNLLSTIGIAWENAAKPAQEISRLVIGRFGLVIAKDAPAWQKMILPIRFFVGGPLGNGQQWYPWIDADDVAKAILFLIENPNYQGVYNITAPHPIRQKDLAKLTAQYLSRPSFVPVPAFALRILLGGVADALLLSSNKVLPQKLEQAGFKFKTTHFEQGLSKWL